MKYYLVIPLLFLVLIGCSKKSSNPVEPTPIPNFITFTKMFGGSADDLGNSVHQTSDSGYIIAGTYNTLSSLYLIKTDARGNNKWEKKLKGSGQIIVSSVMQTPDGSFIICGGYPPPSPQSPSDLCLIKMDSNGEKLWEKVYGEPNNLWHYSSWDLGNCINLTSDGGYIICGISASQVYLVKTDVDGNTLWEKHFGGDKEEEGYSVQQTMDGGFIICGETQSFGSGNSDIYLIKTDESGNKIWEKAIGGTSEDCGYSVQQSTDGGFIIIGKTSSFGAGNDDVFLVKTDSAGKIVWEKTFGGINADGGYSIQETMDAGYVIVGYTKSSGEGDHDVYLIKTNQNGEKLWEKTFGGANTDFGNAVQQTLDGGYIITGGTGSFGAGNYDVYLIKTDSEGNVK